jgi:hypothetical protein
VTTHKYHSFDHYVSEQSENIGMVSEFLNDLFLSYPNVTCKIRYNIPFYDYGSWICYINPIKKSDGVELVFLQGRDLLSIFPFLDSKDRKMVAGIEIKQITDEIIENVVMVWEEAIALQNS